MGSVSVLAGILTGRSTVGERATSDSLRMTLFWATIWELIMMRIRIEGLEKVQRSLKRLPREIESEMDREFGRSRRQDGQRVRSVQARSETEIKRRASRAVDRAIRRVGLGRR